MKKQLQKNQQNSIVLIGLGNPGDEYRETRHNAGFAVIDFLSEKFEAKLKKIFLKPLLYGRIEINQTDIYLIKPLTYMNRSGKILDYVFRKTDCTSENMILICDNMDLSPGLIRLKAKGSSAGHNGIKSVIEYAGTSEFSRLYIGVGRSSTGETVVEHVLGRFSAEERQAFDKAVENAAAAVTALTEKPVPQVMNEINKRNK